MATIKELTERVKRQKSDNASLIEKIEILNSDIKDYEQATKHLINENSLINNKKGKLISELNDCNKKYKDVKYALIIVSGLLSVLMILFFFYGGAIKRLQDTQQDKIEVIRDSLEQSYKDTIWTCNDVISRQARDLIGAQNRFNFAIEYYNSSVNRQISMEKIMCDIILNADKNPADYITLKDSDNDL